MSEAKSERAFLGMTFARLRRVVESILFLGLAGATGALFFFAWLAEEVLEGETQRFDESVRVAVHSFATPSLTVLMHGITTLGSTTLLITIGVCVAFAFMLVGWRRGVVLFAITMAGAIILNAALKLSFHRARPVPFFDTPLPSSYSFPSGHALFSVCFYGVLAWLITARIHRRATQISIWTLAVFLVSLIGLSRIYLGVHYPSDVLAGYAAAFVWLVGVT
nr:phosphatase PAP2 family protein [Pyrinomonadaceae bacterium]